MYTRTAGEGEERKQCEANSQATTSILHTVRVLVSFMLQCVLLSNTVTQ